MFICVITNGLEIPSIDVVWHLKYCPGTVEIPQLFFACSHASHCWRAVPGWLNGKIIENGSQNGFTLVGMLHSRRWVHMQVIQLFVIYQVLWSIWLARN